MNRRCLPAACVLALMCPGCGLVWLPSIEQFPAPVKAICVQDTAGRPVASAHVEVQVIYVDQKSYLFDTMGTYPRFNSDEEHPTRLPVATDGKGKFFLKTATRLAFWQCLWPWSWDGPGNWRYFGHETRIVIDAPGYAPARITYPAGARPGKIEAQHAAIMNDGTLSLGLFKSGSEE